MNKEYEEIRQMLDEAGLIDKSLTPGCVLAIPSGRAHLIRMLGQDIENDPAHYPRYSFFYEVDTKSGKGTFVSDNYYADCKIIGHDFDIREVMQWVLQFITAERIDDAWYNICDERLIVQISGSREFIGADFISSKHLKAQDCSSLLALMKSLN